MIFRKHVKLKNALLATLLMLAAVAGAQTTSSPYSAFGLGDLQSKSFGRSSGMGGVGIGIRLPNMLNVANPASYSTVGAQSFLLDAGMRYEQFNYETSELAQMANSGNLTHLAFAFPVVNGRWYTAVGLMPYSNTGYSISTYSYAPVVGDQTYVYSGEGAINRVFWGNSIRVFKHFSIGANVSYLFGAVSNLIESTVEDEKTASYGYYEDKQVVRDFMLDYGIQYSQTFSEDFLLTIGATLTQATDIKAERHLFETQTNYVDGRQAFDPATGNAYIDTMLHETNDIKLKMPLQYGVGFSLALWQKLVVAADYKQGKWSEANVADIKGDMADSQHFNFGMEYIPNYRSMKYWDRVRYRLGAQFQDTYWQLNGQQISNYSVTLGIGLPMKRSATAFDVAIEFGQRGTLESDLMKETYFKASLSFTLQDFWFIKRKFE